MPAAPIAPAPAPARNCFRVSRMSAGRLDEHQVAQHAMEVGDHLRVGERQGDVLAELVQVTAVVPGVEDVPEIGVLVDGVDGGSDAALSHGSPLVAEAGDGLAIE